MLTTSHITHPHLPPRLTSPHIYFSTFLLFHFSTFLLFSSFLYFSLLFFFSTWQHEVLGWRPSEMTLPFGPVTKRVTTRKLVRRPAYTDRATHYISLRLPFYLFTLFTCLPFYLCTFVPFTFYLLPFTFYLYLYTFTFIPLPFFLFLFLFL